MKKSTWYLMLISFLLISIAIAAQTGWNNGDSGLTVRTALQANDTELYSVSGVSDCTVGPCFDGTADSGTILYLMNPAGTFYTSIQGGATLANRLIRPPIGAPAAGNLIQTDVNGNWSYIDTITIGFERYITSEGLVPAGGFEHRFDFGTLTESKDFIVDDMATKDTAWIITDTGTAISVADGVQGYPVPSSWAGKSISSIIIVVDTAGVTGTSDFQIRRVRAGTPVDVLSTVATIDTTELTSVTAATPYVINTANDDMAEGDKLFIDVNAISTTPPEGASVTVEVY